MLTTSAYGLAILLDVFIIIIGVRFLLVPHAAAAGYGVPAKKDGDAAYLTIKGLRDSSYGILGLALLAFAGARAEAWFMLIVALAPSATPPSSCATPAPRRPPSASTSPPP
jgi:hypothetical protein